MNSYALFKTPIGICGISWSEKGITVLQLPERTPEETKRHLIGKKDDVVFVEKNSLPNSVKRAVKEIQALLEGRKADFSQVQLDLNGVPEFHKRVYQAARTIPHGEVKTYGEIAAVIQSPRAARAVGNALSRNPIPLIIPCHRVIGADGNPGGFSAYGALKTKEELLKREGVNLFQSIKPSGRGSRIKNSKSEKLPGSTRALEFLTEADPKLGDLIQKVGPCRLKPDLSQDPFHAFLEAILYQQLTAKAAQTILGRLKLLFPHQGFPSPEELLELPEEKLRSAGISRNKALAIRDLAVKTLEGVVPTLQVANKMADLDLIQCMIKIRGIGQWTVEMFLIFNLGRPDVLPAADYGVRKGFARTYSREKLPTPKELAAHGEKWKPHRTTAAWYLWRALELPEIRR
jgi:O-6-methylguanine DNA methyltransferase